MWIESVSGFRSWGMHRDSRFRPDPHMGELPPVHPNLKGSDPYMRQLSRKGVQPL